VPRNRKFEVRLSDIERGVWEAAAEAAGLTLTAFVRAAVTDRLGFSSPPAELASARSAAASPDTDCAPAESAAGETAAESKAERLWRLAREKRAAGQQGSAA
jgi:hypothetical protein